MEGENNCLSTIDENTEDNQMERSTPGSTEQVTESGTTADFSEIWSEFKCVFCSQDLKEMTNPKLLPCLHTACESCLTSEVNGESSPSSSGADYNNIRDVKKKKCRSKKKDIKRSERGIENRITKLRNGVKQIQCPACSQEINIDDAVDHLFLMEYVQNSENLPEESSYPCTSCEEGNEGTGFCQDCQEWLCETCVTAHHRVRVTKDHVVRSKEEMEGENAAMHNQKYLLCHVHPNEQLKVYCETCDKLTCRDCQLSDHKAHKYQFLRNACEEEQKDITELLEKIKEKQGHMEEASNNLNKRLEEIVAREGKLAKEIQVFGVQFITDINKRAKSLLQDLSKVCSEKKNLINVKTQELQSLKERLSHGQKFAEAAMALGSETALVYSKKPIMNQLRRILRHKCDVPNPHHVVDIQFSYESSFLTQYIGQLGHILVDQQPLPGSGNPSAMLPMPQTISQGPVSNTPPARQVPVQMQMNQRATIPPVQIAQQPIGPYGQPQVTSSTDLVRNNNPQMRQMIQNNQVNYGRPGTVTPQRGVLPNQQGNFQMQPNATYVARQQMVQNSQNQATQLRQRAQQRQIQQQQAQQQMQQPPMYNSVQLPMPLRQNKNISVTQLPSPSGPSPSKQRAIAPRSNMSINNQGNSVLRMNNTQGIQSQNQPQLIVLDDNQKTPNMSNTARLSHFPSNLQATLAANPSLQIQPATNNNFSNMQPNVELGISPMHLTCSTSSTDMQSIPILQYLMQSDINAHQSIALSAAAVNVCDMPANDATNKMHQYFISSQSQSNNSNPANISECSEPVIERNTISDSDNISKGITTPVLRNLLVEKKAAVVASSTSNTRCNSPESTSSESLPSLDSLLNLSTLENVCINSVQENVKEPSSQTSKESVIDTIKSTNSNSSELSSVFQKSCRTTEGKCVVCKEGKDLIYCSVCNKAYHMICHVPGIYSKIVEINWICIMCRDVLTYPIPDEEAKKKLLDLQGRELLICERILMEVFTHSKSWPFHNKVSKKVPNYYRVIKRPMDLSTIRSKLYPMHFQRYSDVEEFCSDVRLIFENCFLFNSEGSDVYNAGKELQEFFEALLGNYFPELTLSDAV